MLFRLFYDISIKVIGYEWENNEFASPREDRPPAESPSAECRLVRPGAAMETWPEAHRYRGIKCVPLRHEFGWYRGRISPFVPIRDGRFFYLSLNNIFNIRSMTMKAQLEAIRSAALEAINGTQTSAELDAVRVQYLGKKGELTAVLKQMGKLSPEERPVMGQMANDVRAALETAIEAQSSVLAEKALIDKLAAETVDVTIPGKEVKIGHKHPMYIALDEIKDIFVGMGFTVLDGPEVELAELNFDRLNAEEGHPSRDWSDTFYFDEDSRVMLRSQTSPMQVRAMETMELPIRIIAPGRVYRKDEVDATHSPMFHQVEGMVIDKNVTMADLKGTLNTVVEKLYGEGTKTRFRPHHFPFTEPSCEMDVQCHKCGGVGCPTCKGEGWIELLGAGMIHPRVLEMSGIDPEVYSGWAFGIGLERTAMRRFKIADLRLIFENDVRFLEQF